MAHAVDGILGGVFPHLFTTDGREGVAYAGKEQSEIVIDLCRRAYGGAWVATDDALLYGYGWRNAKDEVAFGFVDATEKLAGIGREALYLTALTLGIKGVEGQGRLARTAHAGDDNQFVVGQLDIDVLKVIDACPLDGDMGR